MDLCSPSSTTIPTLLACCWTSTSRESSPTWTGRTQQFQLRSFDFGANDRCAVVDDWITTGESLRSVVRAITSLGASYVGASVIVDKSASDAFVARSDLAVSALVTFDEIMKRVPDV